jgi:hypothetical protein
LEPTGLDGIDNQYAFLRRSLYLQQILKAHTTKSRRKKLDKNLRKAEGGNWIKT